MTRLLAAVLFVSVVTGPAAAQPTVLTSPPTAPSCEEALREARVLGNLYALSRARVEEVTSKEIARMALEIAALRATVDALQLEKPRARP